MEEKKSEIIEENNDQQPLFPELSELQEENAETESEQSRSAEEKSLEQEWPDTPEIILEEADKQQLAFGYVSELKELWEEEWQGMPEFIQENLMPWRTLYVHFEDQEDIDAFSKLVDQKLTDLTKYIWYPKVPLFKSSDYKYIDES